MLVVQPHFEGSGAAITQWAQIEEICEKLKSVKYFGLDLEVSYMGKGTLDLYRGQLEGIALAYRLSSGEVEAFYIPFLYYPNCLPMPKVMAYLHKSVLSDPSKKVFIHEAFYDGRAMILNGYPLAGRLLCTRIASWILDSNGSHSLNACGERELGVGKVSTFKEMEATSDLFNPFPMPEYARQDAKLHLLLGEIYLEKIAKANLMKIYDLEMDALPDVMEMALRGMCPDIEYFEELKKKYRVKLQALTGDMREITKVQNLDPNSTDKIANVLWKVLDLKPPAWAEAGKKGYVSTKLEVLEAISDQHPFVKLLIEHRHVSQYLENYVEIILRLAKKSVDGRLHPQFNQALKSGRMSVQEPALQTLPRVGEGIEIRGGIVAPEGKRLIRSDFSQIELRFVGYLAKDEAIISTYENYGDIHQQTADACSCSRTDAKTVNFGLIYGMRPHKLARQINMGRIEFCRARGGSPEPITLALARSYYKGYFKQYFGVLQWHDRVEQHLLKYFSTETIFGLKRHFLIKDILARATGDLAKNNEFQSALRQAINHIVQGSAAQLTKIAMRNARAYRFGGRVEQAEKNATQEELKILHSFPPSLRETAFPIMQVHDELIWEAPDSAAEELALWLKTVMETALKLPRIPILAEAKVVGSLGTRN